MARSIRKPEANPLDSRIPDLKGKIPALDDLIRRLEIPDYVKPLPPPKVPGDPFGPVPIIPPPAPTWPYGPPYLGRTPTPAPLFGASSNEFVSPLDSTAAGEPGGLLGMMQRSGAIGGSDRQDTPAGGFVELLQEYLRSHRGRDD